MAELFQCFPHLMSERLIIRKMFKYDIDSLSEITNNENEYRYIPLFLYKKSRGNLLAAIRNLGGRDFDKNIDTKCDTTYNIDRRYSECQNGINY